jgi:hypothetical protein
MGMIQDDIDTLVTALYGEGREGGKIAKRLIETGLRLMIEEEAFPAHKVSIVPVADDGSFKIEHHYSPVAMLNRLLPPDKQLGAEDSIILDVGKSGSSFSISWAQPGFKLAIVPEDYMPPTEKAGTGAVREPVSEAKAVSAGPAAPELIINAVSAIREILFNEIDFPVPSDDIGHKLEAIDQLLDKLVFVTDADIPDYIRTKAYSARIRAGRGEEHMGHYATMLEALAEEIGKDIHVGLEDPEKALREITTMIGEGNVKAGWWTEQNVDLRACPYTQHVIATKLMLVCTEVSEGMEGWRKSQKTIKMDDHLPNRPMFEVELADAHIRLFDLGANAKFPDGRKLDVPGAIIEKLAYNAVRPDHKIENRMAEGGKSS